MNDRVSGAGTDHARVLIGGVGYRWQCDASFGLVVADALAGGAWPEGVDVMDLGYGALYAAQDIRDASPPYDRLILIAAPVRGRTPGRLYRRPWEGDEADDEELQERIREAGAGVIDLDNLLVIARYFNALPPEVLLFELEPVDLSGGLTLSAEAERLVPEVMEAVRAAALAPRGKPIKA